MLIRLKDERGMAMVTVILAMFVIVTVSVGVFQLAVGNLSHSAYDRKRDQALQAAQGAVDSYIASLPTTTTTKICNGLGSGSTYTLSTAPAVTFRANVWWSADGTTFTACPTAPSAAVRLKYLVVTGTGSAGVAGTVARKWQTLVTLQPIIPGTQSAFYGASGLCIGNGPTITHNVAGNDARLYSGGDINTTSLCGSTTSGNMVIEGNIYAQGSIDHMSGCIEGNVWAGGSVNLNSITVGYCKASSYPSGFSITANSPPNPVCSSGGTSGCYFLDSQGNPYGNVKAGGGNVTLSSAAAYGTCLASGSQSWSSSQCSPNKDSSGFAPAPCTGTVGDGTANCGSNNVTGLGKPPTSDMPYFSYAASDWSPTYAVVNEVSADCVTTIPNDIASKIASGVGGNYNIVFYVNAGCALTIPNNTRYNLRGNAIIVTTGSFSANGLTVTTSAGSCNTNATDNLGNPLYPNGKCQFDVIVPATAVPNPTATCVPPTADPGTWDITYGTTTDTSGVDGLNYTPCWLFVNQQSKISGEGIAGVVSQGNNFQMTFHPLTIPGFTPTGYNAAPSYFRECPSGTPYCT